MFKVIFKEKGRKSVYISSKYTISYIYIYIYIYIRECWRNVISKLTQKYETKTYIILNFRNQMGS